ncbi:hypothetical protein [Streptosporangium fragile]|uniref:hypothetical protein n=1 Tax=Streptosporangium fragile TaxID=46186 RepID=UPI0031E6335D
MAGRPRRSAGGRDRGRSRGERSELLTGRGGPAVPVGGGQIDGAPLEESVDVDFGRREGWEYRLA